jgi:tetratricopeptide (TPR) repeat protein
MSALILYWTGHYADAIARAQEAIEIARAVNDTSNLIRALSDLGLALGASGRYEAALGAFEQARRFGQEYGIETWVARAISMRGGLHLEVLDFTGAETLAEEARELGRSVNFLHAVVSGGIDLLLTFARRGDVGRTERLIDEVAQAAHNASGSHGWLWRLRLTQARAEIALARGDWTAACRWASDTVEQSMARGRPKYEALARATRGQALAQRGHPVQALVELRAAVTVARTTGDPTLFLRTAALLLALDGNDSLLAESRSAVEQIARSLSNTGLRQRFAAAEPVRMLARLTPLSTLPFNCGA